MVWSGGKFVAPGEDIDFQPLLNKGLKTLTFWWKEWNDFFF